MASEVGEGPSTSSSPSKEKMEAKLKAANLLAQGKRNLICGEIPEAVQQFQDACQNLSSAYGEMAKECAEAYFHYGCALLDLSRMEEGVLGNALEGVDVEADDDEEPNNKEQFESTDNIGAEERQKLRLQVVAAMSEDEASRQSLIQGNKEGKEPVEEKADGDALQKETEMEENDENQKVNNDKDRKPSEEEDMETHQVAEDSKSETDVQKERSRNDSGNLSKKVAKIAIDEEAEKINTEAEKINTEAEKINTEETKDEKVDVEESSNMDEVDGEVVGGETKPEAGKEGESAAGKEGGSAEGKEGESAEGKEGESAEGKEGESAEGTEEEEEEEEGEGEEEEGEEDGVESQEDGDQKEDEDNPDDVPNLQLAWEMLELSKVIYGKDSSKDSQLKAAEACLKVGEVSLETEQYEQAISDYLACLKIQRDFLESSDRAIAETCYQLGLAYQLNKQQDLAIEHFKSAVTCLEETMVKLQIVVKEKPPKEPSQFLEPAEVAEKEIKELEQILPEIKEKIKDAEEESKMMDNLKAMAKDAMGSVFSAVADSTTEIGFGSSSKSPVKSTTTETGFGSSSKSPVKSTEEKKTSDISHLIRKKRKPGEETEVDGEDLENKKQKQEGASGDAPAQNGCSEEKVSTEAVSAT